MAIINFFGDFKCDDVSRLKLDNTLSKILSKGDINVLNFEAPISVVGSIPIEKSGPNITNDENAPDFLLKAGFNLFSLANNHIYDYGKEGLNHTREMFPDGKVIGAGSWHEAYRPVIITISSLRIGFIALTHHEFGVLYEQQYHEQEVGAAWMLHPCIDEVIIDTKQKCDYLFILPHCGMEHEYYPMPEVRTLYKHWITMGADGVFASHPHTVRPWEFYEGKPIVYSLGNFCFDSLATTVPDYWYWSLVASFIIDHNGMRMEVSYCKYNEETGLIKIVDDEFFAKHISDITKVFNKEEDYLAAINAQCVKYEKMYDVFFARSGYYKLSMKVVIKQLMRYIIGRYKPRLAPLKNNFKCETHRWTISRILDLKR